MKEIKLTRGKFAMVDDDDFEILSQYKWHSHFDGYNWYAHRRFGTDRHIAMHHDVIMRKIGLEVDHIDRNGLNNQKSNLRLVTHAENCRNRSFTKLNKSGYKGVSWKKKNKRWCAQITANGTVTHLGLFKSVVEAAKCYDAAAEQMYGKLALTNKKLGKL